MRGILINCLLLASLAAALPNGRNKRDFTFLKDLMQKILYGKNEINIEFNPSSEEKPKETSKFRLYELPGYDDVLIKVPVDYLQTNNEVPVNLNAFGATVGTKTPGHTFHALRNVNNLVSSSILNENHDQVLKGSFGPLFPNNSHESESNEQEIKSDSAPNMGEAEYTGETDPLEEIQGYEEPVERINYEKPQNEEQPMMYSVQREQRDPETIEANSDLPNCDQLRVDTGILLPADQYQVEPAPETYPGPAFVNVFYPNVPADQNVQNPLDPPKTTERNHHDHHKHPRHHHHSHHHSHHQRPHHHHHHRPHHHEHTKLNKTSPASNGTISNDEIEGSTPSSSKPEASTTEDPLNYRVQFVSRLTNTETFQGINTGQTVQANQSNGTGEYNANNPTAANYGSSQYVYRNQDNLKMVTFEDKLKTNNHTNTKEQNTNISSPVTDSKDEESEVKHHASENVTSDQNSENSTTSTEGIRIEDRLIPERSRKINGHHHRGHPPRRHHHHHHPHHRHHHAINPHPIHFHIPETFGLNENSDYEGNGNGMASEDSKPDEVPLQRFGDDLKTNVQINNETDVNATDNYAPPVSDSTETNKAFEEKENTVPSETADQSDYHNPMSNDKVETVDQDDLTPKRSQNVHHHHRSRHPSRRHRHHHHRGHHSHSIGSHKPKYVHFPIFDSDAFKSIMNANTLHTNKVAENAGNTEEPATEFDENKLKENEWKTNAKPRITDKVNDNSTDNQNNSGNESIREEGYTGNSNSKNRGDIPDEQ